MENDEFIRTDCGTIWSQIKNQEKLIQIKRRWLLGVPLIPSQKKLFMDSQCDLLPESFLREDDLFYENVKSAVQAADGKRVSQVFQDDTVTFDRKRIFRALLSGLDDLNTKGLHLVATTLTQGLVKFEETRWQMKKIIRESLRKKFDDDSGVFRELSQHLSDPHNFRDMFGTVLPSTPQSCVRKVLDGLEDLPLEALIAMFRKLGGRELASRLNQTKSKKGLIIKIRNTCKKMLSELGTGDEVQGSLAKAMAVPGVSLKLQPGFRNSTATEFYQFSEEIKILQDDIASAIQLVSCRSMVSEPELEHLMTLLDRDAKTSKKRFRYSVIKMLTEYLFECDDLDKIPESLTKALDFINKKSQKKLLRPNLKDEIDEEVECILNVSAQTKQIVWDMFPDNELDLDFADAYVEKMEDEDEDDGDDWSSEDYDNHDQVSPHEQRMSESVISHSDDNESIGESRPFTSNLPTATTTKGDSNPPDNSSVYVEELETVFSNQGINGDSIGIKRGFHGISTERHEPECNQSHVEPDDLDKQTTCNQYLAIQKVCDETSMIARDIVGHMLEEFAQIEGLDLDCDDISDLDCDDNSDSEVVEGRQTSSQENISGSVIVNVIEDLIPSFPKSGMETIRKLVGK